MRDTDVADDVTRAAVRLFAAQGYANTSVQQIVEAAGVTKGAMFQRHPLSFALVPPGGTIAGILHR